MSEQGGAAQKAKAMIKEVYDDGCAEINGREYKFNKTTHKKRLRIFAAYSKFSPLIQRQDFSFLAWDEWDTIIDVIGGIVTYDGMQLTKLPAHWDKHPEDFIQFIAIALPVIAYPFFPESGGN